MSVLVLGAGGFLGKHITGALQNSGHDVATLGRSGSMDFVVDAADLESLRVVVRETAPSAVINLLGVGLSDPDADPQQMELINARFPARLAALLAEMDGSTRLVHAASSTELPAPGGSYESQYSQTKAEGTESLLTAAVDLPITVLRVHNTYGADQPARRFVASVIDSLAVGRRIELRYPDRVRDFIHVDDVAACFVDAVDLRHTSGATYEVGTGAGTSLSSVVRMVADISGYEYRGTSQSGGEDHHPFSVASQEYLLRPATIDLREGLERAIRERRMEGEES